MGILSQEPPAKETGPKGEKPTPETVPTSVEPKVVEAAPTGTPTAAEGVPGKTAEEGLPKPGERDEPEISMPEPFDGVDIGSFIKSNPFGLERGTPKATPPPKTVIRETKPIVRLTGMTAFRGNKKVLLEIKVSGAAATPLYHTLREGDSANGVKVLSIDPEKGRVELEIKGDKEARSFDEDEEGEVEPMGPSSGGTRTNRRPPIQRPKDGGRGPLKTIPTRNNRSETKPAPFKPPPAAGKAVEYRELPAFDEVTQTEMIVASQIKTQRELPRGVVDSEPPTDLPLRQR
ncbi:MAG: hypothetical protein CMO66_01390 [Verrucomicrobiales bacterium]|nr:hypothetical protein [Verrucomicrobiales bacterium]